MDFLNSIKEQIPEYAKDIRLNIDSVVARSSLAHEDALGVALAAAFAARSPQLVEAFKAAIPGTEGHAALTAAALMGMNNVWYLYVEMAGDEELKTARRVAHERLRQLGRREQAQVRDLRPGRIHRGQVPLLREAALRLAEEGRHEHTAVA